jgi:hypothetical protein
MVYYWEPPVYASSVSLFKNYGDKHFLKHSASHGSTSVKTLSLKGMGKTITRFL